MTKPAGRPKGAKDKRPRRLVHKVKVVSPALEWVLSNVDKKDAVHEDLKVMGLLKMVRSNPKAYDRLMWKWTDAQLEPDAQDVPDTVKDEPLIRLVDSLMEEWKKKAIAS